MDVGIVKKNSYDFSAVKEVLNEVNNNEFKSGESDFYSLLEGHLSVDTSKSYIWTALSAVADDTMEALYQNVLNYIDNASNIDTCTVKALQSMVQILGTKFSVFDNLSKCPPEVMNLIDVFSMRKDYLLNSEKVCQQLVDELSAGEVSILTTKVFDDGTEADYISCKALDNLISCTFYDVLSTHVYRTYGSSVSVDYIYQSLSDDILNNGFEIPNAYADLIQSYKLKWNIGSEFDTDLEADNIDNGLSALEDYTDREQTILSVEFARRKAAKYELEPKSRFAYYKELDVKNYFSFIEETYNESYNVYSVSEPYDIDKNYIEVNTLSSAKLLRNTGNGAEINSNMLLSVAGRLQQIVTQIRAIREYLKSHAQRNYMKGTFLLLSYIVNEYLRNNVYPMLPELGYHDTEFVSDKNKLELVEYIDQTQYNNIQTDIEEDADDKSLNPPYWKDNGANGAAIALDSTNVFRPADKLKVVTPTTFAQEEIEDFYINVLNNQTGISRLSTHESLYDFLITLFKVGADNSYMTADGKVMCELQNTAQTDSAEEWNSSRRFTKDIDKYILELSAAQDACAYLMNGYEPLPNITYQTQIDEIQTFYSEKAAAAYTDQLDAKIAELNAEVQKCNEFVNEVKQLTEQFNELTAQFSNLVVSNAPYTGEFILSSKTFRKNLQRYSSFISKLSFQQKVQVQRQVYAIEQQYTRIFNAAQKELETKLATSIKLKSTTFNDYLLMSTYQIQVVYNTILSYYVQVHGHGVSEFEDIENNVVNDINTLQTTLQTQISNVFLRITEAIIEHKSTVQYSEIIQLSALLSAFLYDQNDIHNCTNDVAYKLDYTQSDWYKYKESLFNKYTGLSTSDLPFYYVENTTHPSYQIHPCLSNFIEYVDYSFPIKNLAGLAQKTISDIASTAAQMNIDDNGYLKDIWNNPLNSNQDYLTRYEKSSHIDELGNVNKHFGFDGMLYPDIKTENFSSIISHLNNEKADEDKYYSGLNISKNEAKLIANRLATFQSFYNDLENHTYQKIKRYANDIYGNSYILVSVPNNDDDDVGILMFRAKNYPIAFPALVYNEAGIYQKDLSEIDLTYDNANQYFNKLKKIQIPNTDKLTPAFADFTFATDKTTMILNGFKADASVCTYRTSIPVIANIIQEFQMDIDKQYFVRTFARDKTDHSLQHLEIPSDLSPEAYYYDGRHIGQIYASLTGDKLKLGVCKYFHDNVNAQYKTTNFVSAEFDNIKANDILKIKFSCRSNGTFSIAYIPENGSIENTKLSSYTGSQIDKYSNLTSTINIFDKLIRTHDFAPVFESETILMTGTQNYAPYVDMGFIRLADHNNIKWELSSTAFSTDFNSKKPLQFEFDIPLNNVGTSAKTKEQLKQNNVKHGIDFKFICPIRVEEIEAGDTDESKLSVNDQYTNIAFKTNYGKYPLPANTELKHYAVTDVHMYDTIYNQYVLSGHIPEWLDLDGYEQTLFDHPNGDRATVFTEYIDLMRYDVARYLSAQCEEYRNSDIASDGYSQLKTFSDERYQMITEPFFVSQNQWEKLKTSSYVKGNVLADTASNVDYTGHYRFSLADGIEISAEVMKNDYGTVKIDFNPIYYFRPQATVANSNIANRMHLFLNLDKPGDSGYLNIYEKGTADRITLKTDPAINILATVFIKNISTTVPRFVLKAVYLHTDSNESDDQHFIEVAAEKESHMFRAENQQQHQEYVLTDESLEALPIDLS